MALEFISRQQRHYPLHWSSTSSSSASEARHPAIHQHRRRALQIRSAPLSKPGQWITHTRRSSLGGGGRRGKWRRRRKNAQGGVLLEFPAPLIKALRHLAHLSLTTHLERQIMSENMWMDMLAEEITTRGLFLPRHVSLALAGSLATHFLLRLQWHN